MEVNAQISVDEKLFDNSYEKDLYSAFKTTITKHYDSFEENLDALFALKPQIDAFFDNVMVNTEDLSVRANRQNLIASVYNAFKSIADIKEISI
jgi:glycyl-tRNA synthetase beta chain